MAAVTREAKPASLTTTEHHKTSAASGSIITRARGSTYEASLNFTSTSKFLYNRRVFKRLGKEYATGGYWS